MMPKGWQPSQCIVSGCSARMWALGLCHFHWQRWYRRQPLERVVPPPAGWLQRGYQMICTPDGREMHEHRYRVEQQLGRQLLPHEYVHHKDGNKLNNELANLEVVDWATHTRDHRRNAPKGSYRRPRHYWVRPCQRCGVPLQRPFGYPPIRYCTQCRPYAAWETRRGHATQA